MAHLDLIDPDYNYNPLNIDCNYYDKLTLKPYIETESGLSIISANIRSANRNFDDFIGLLNSFKVKFHTIILCESWLSSESDWVPVPGYTAFHSVRSVGRGGGVSILVDEIFASSLVHEISHNNEFIESCGVKVVCANKECFVTAVYRPPNSGLNSFNNYMLHILEYLQPNRNEVVIAGEFNVDVGSKNLSYDEKKYIE